MDKTEFNDWQKLVTGKEFAKVPSSKIHSIGSYEQDLPDV